jgi:hypothetical protein
VHFVTLLDAHVDGVVGSMLELCSIANLLRQGGVVPGSEGTLVAALDGGPDDDAEELAELTQRLRGELLELDVDAVELAAWDHAPEGAKGLELLGVGALVVQFALRPQILTSVVDATVAWLGRQRNRTVKLTLDDDSLEVTGVSTREQQRLIELWIARHVGDS